MFSHKEYNILTINIIKQSFALILIPFNLFLKRAISDNRIVKYLKSIHRTLIKVLDLDNYLKKHKKKYRNFLLYNNYSKV